MAFALGLRHGFDLDHLATIDSITRTVKTDMRLSRCVGVLFSFGHGLVVILMSLIIASGVEQSPPWLESVGQWVSIVFLLAFGFLTLWNVWSGSAGLPVGFTGLMFKKFSRDTYNPFVIMLIGALFALSFDTFTQVALLSISVSVMAEYFFVVMLGIIFMLGMMTSDGLNGFFVSKLIQQADRKSVIVSRTTGLVIAGFSLILGVSGLLEKF